MAKRPANSPFAPEDGGMGWWRWAAMATDDLSIGGIFRSVMWLCKLRKFTKEKSQGHNAIRSIYIAWFCHHHEAIAATPNMKPHIAILTTSKPSSLIPPPLTTTLTQPSPTGVRLLRHRREASELAEPVVQRADDLLVTRCLLQRREGMHVSQLGP